MLTREQIVAAIEKGISNARQAREPVRKSAPVKPRAPRFADLDTRYLEACIKSNAPLADHARAELVRRGVLTPYGPEPEPDPLAGIVERLEGLQHDLTMNTWRVDNAVKNAVDRSVRNQPRQPDVLELLLETEQPESEPEPNPALQKAAEVEAAYHRACDAYEDAVLRDGRERTPDSYQASLDAYEAMLIAKRAFHR